ncbi:MAG: hypothetical protein ACI84C_001498 [Flavobacteriales bacterium]|jgi:hypothetical protein
MSNSPRAEESEQNLESTNLLVFFFRWKWMIMGVCFVAAVASAIASLLIEEKYRSTVVMFATQQHSIGEQFLEDIKRKDLLEYGEKDDAERLLQLLNSEHIRNVIIERFDLWTDYDIDESEMGSHALIALEYESNVTAKMTRFGSVQVDVMDKNPVAAMNIANTIVDLADTLSNELRSGRAQLAFGYAKTSYENLQGEITMLEDSMESLRRLGVYDYITQIEGLNEQYATAINEGRNSQATSLNDKMIELSQYGSIYTKLETLIESAYEREAILKRRYDLMYIDVTSNLPSKFVVDSAAISDKKAYPVRWLIVAMSIAAAFVFIVFVLLTWDSFHRLRLGGKI